MRAGTLRKRVELQTPTERRNEYGEPEFIWNTSATRWVGIESVDGRESFENNKVGGMVTHKITMRYESGVTPKMRFLFGSRVFNIGSVINMNERNKELLCLCKEAV